MASRKTILVLHFTGQCPLAGVAWQAVHYVVGLTRLGYDVYYVEDSGAVPYDPRIKSVAEDCSYNVAFVQNMMERFDLGKRWAYWDLAHNTCYGLSREKLLRLYGEADALFNLCGATWLREEHLQCPVRIYVDTDPVYEQVKLAQDNQVSKANLDAHTHHFTYGENLGNPDCPIPLKEFVWKTTRPPVVLECWEPKCNPLATFFTSIASWENKGKDITFGSQTYQWSKHVNFLHFLDLPCHTSQRFYLAMKPNSTEVEAQVRAMGWELVDPVLPSSSFDAYREFIYSSRGEFTVAKDIYVRPRSGWFSDRSVCYLAAGKPVITQETGFSKFIPTGQGLFAFSTMEEVLVAIDQINSDYARHCQVARKIAQEYFDSDKVLAKMLKDVGFG